MKRKVATEKTKGSKRRAYSKYKASGVEWLGDVPVHWEVKKLKYLVQKPLQYGANESAELDDLDLPRYIRITDVDEYGNLRDETFRSLPEEIAKPYLLKDGDLLFARSGATVGKTFFYKKSWGRAAYAGYLIRAQLNIKIANPNYVNLITKSYFYDQWIQSILIQATIQNVSAEKYASFLIPLPPLHEQQVIAAYLDRETGRIDSLIAKKKKLVDLLKEKRSALISAVVTGKIDVAASKDSERKGYPRYKPSGVEWLGDVPEHWEVKKLRYLCTIETGDKDTINAEDDGQYPFFVRSQTVERINTYTKNCEGVLTAGDGVGVGKVFHYIKGKFDFHQRVYLFSQFRNVIGMYFYLYLKEMFWRVAFDGGAKSTVDSLRRPMISNFPVVVPTYPEQQAIAVFLERETSKIDALVTKVETAIERLQEYRTALISSVVTGKIDVSIRRNKGKGDIV